MFLKYFMNKGRIKIMKKILLSLFAFVLMMPLAVAAQYDSSKSSKMAKTQDIVETAKSAKMFNTLLKAAKAAGLAEMLKMDGPYTVFAPTDDAFAKIPKETLNNLLKPENKEMLANVLKYHVVSGKVLASEVVGMDRATTALGQDVMIMTEGGKVMLNNSATVIKTDVMASNGVIHVIDTVLMPKM